MKKFLKFLGILILILAIIAAVFYYKNNEELPTGVQGKEADALAQKMLTALNQKYLAETEVIEWSFRGEHFYKWYHQKDVVMVSWNDIQVELHTKEPSKSKVLKSKNKAENKKHIEQATNFFNNDSFWLMAPYKVMDPGVERRLVQYNDKAALLVTYTSGGSTPGDSYLWILDKNGMPTEYKMWVGIIPLGGVSATWSDWTNTDTGIKLPTKHSLSLFGMQLDLGKVKAYNEKADALAHKILKTIKHDAYTKTRYIEWSFRGARFFKWDKQEHIVEVKWDENTVILHPNELEKSRLFINETEVVNNKESTIQRALDIFNNDSFWLVAPHKLFEDGIIRTLEMVDGEPRLKVKYTTGGSTPGDSYVWIVNEDYLPIRFKMYVPSMRMNGLEATWDEWITTESGALLPQNHSIGNRQLSMGTVKAYN
ncbi:hypothetical protein GCM10011416_00410 [Polaribacter pacificus]|uniref:Uncharacterized protein n=1 Tax=Polaribacter pacificus TaxID=1775173 RepID=A0A917HSS6_9FLAO|nr:hypothetical protein [Polaribacter pacificus]GGG88099.1 hypothetical protein GCM10011416_00410 [Polaribacter pacificus]